MPNYKDIGFGSTPKPTPSSTVEAAEDLTLKQDATRVNYRPVTSIVVRAKLTTGEFGRCDIAHLDQRSLRRWLAQDFQNATRTVMFLLGHPIE